MSECSLATSKLNHIEISMAAGYNGAPLHQKVTGRRRSLSTASRWVDTEAGMTPSRLKRSLEDFNRGDLPQCAESYSK